MIETETFLRNCKAARAAAAEAAEERARNFRELTALCALTGHTHNGPGNSVGPPGSAMAGTYAPASDHNPLTVFDPAGNIVTSVPIDEVLFMLVED